jgi:hypothetical protein
MLYNCSSKISGYAHIRDDFLLTILMLVVELQVEIISSIVILYIQLQCL